MVRVATYYFPQCPLHSDCTATSWHRIKKCGSTTLGEAQEKLVHHLVNSKLHYVNKGKAEEIAASASYEVHESDDGDDEEEEDALLAALQLRPTSPPRSSRPSSIRDRSRSPTLPMVTVTAHGLGLQLQARAAAARRATESALDASRHAKRLSLSAAAAYETEIKRLEVALEDLKELV
jgi:hypothetical protein